MLTHRKTIEKCRRLEGVYRELIFAPVLTVPARRLDVAREHRRTVPGADEPWQSCEVGEAWGGEWTSTWFAGSAEIPVAWADTPLFLSCDSGAFETLVFVDGQPAGMLSRPVSLGMVTHGHHRFLRLTPGAAAGARFDLALECYAGHPSVGGHALMPEVNRMAEPGNYQHLFQGLVLNRRRPVVGEFLFDLLCLNQLIARLPEDGFLRGAAMAALETALPFMPQEPDPTDEAAWIPCLEQARAVFAPVLARHNGDGGAELGLVGHSHLDTAWLWTIDETIRKAARTFSTALAMMDQYPEYTFFQSAAYHLELMRRHYPDLHRRICERIREGRWQFEGGTWIEPDCNIPSGESLVRQFLWGQRSFIEHRGSPSTIYWQPDVFGYSAALPQIMRQAGVRTFCTTKLGWNETNPFPYDNFTWRGIDGSEVFAHFNTTHGWADPGSLITWAQEIKHKDRDHQRLIAYGYGDGGGGPMYDMIEVAGRCRDLAGCPRASHVQAESFLDGIAAQGNHPVWQGELYLELHRGTYTTKHFIKAGNRHLEQALRDLEIIDAVLGARAAEAAALRGLWETLLVNQFHDILPGTSLPEVHARAEREFADGLKQAEGEIRRLLAGGEPRRIALANTLGWDRHECLELTRLPAGLVPSGTGVVSQMVEDVAGETCVLSRGLALPALACTTVELAAPVTAASPFHWDGRVLDAPLLRLEIDPAGRILSWLDKPSGREIRQPGAAPLACFWFGEDLPRLWDNWDIDPDQHLMMAPIDTPCGLRVVADGPLQWRLRLERPLGAGSSLRLDLIVEAAERGVAFDAQIDWRERHRLLKIGFPLAVHRDQCRHEIQFGHVDRATHFNLPTDRARYEVCQQRYSDCSEPRFGVALFNESSYGLSTHDNHLQLTLLKSGTHPDPTGDDGVHRLRFALRAHDGFSAANVIRPALAFNAPVRWAAAGGTLRGTSWCTVDQDNVVIEAIKRAEDGRGLILRLYESEGSQVRCRLRFAEVPASLMRCDLLERDEEALALDAEGGLSLDLPAFAIRSFRLL